MAGKLFIKTHGCQMNEYDSSKMADVLGAEHGLTLTENEAEADVVLVNTCAIREKAQEKVFSQLGRWKQLKARNPKLVIGVGGCVASQEGENIIKRAPFVDLVFGPQTLHRLPQMVDRVRSEGRSQVDISFPEIEKFDSLPEPRAEGPTAFVSIMEGCSKYCSFCVVPYTRGEEISRPFDDVVAEVAMLAEQGVREVNLLGQNVNAYRGAMHDGAVCDLGLLIQYLAQIDGIGRIRFTTSHPLEFNDSLVRAYAECDKLANYLHLPVQSGSDRILSAMKRGHTAIEYKQKIRKLRAARPGISISTDIIVGFPGETEADFEILLDFIRAAQLDRVGCFQYSPVKGARANALPDPVADEVKQERWDRFMALQQEISSNKLQQKIGRTIEILIDEVDDTGAVGRSSADAPEIDGKVFLEGVTGLHPGDFVEAQVTAADEYDVWAG